MSTSTPKSRRRHMNLCGKLTQYLFAESHFFYSKTMQGLITLECTRIKSKNLRESKLYDIQYMDRTTFLRLLFVPLVTRHGVKLSKEWEANFLDKIARERERDRRKSRQFLEKASWFLNNLVRALDLYQSVTGEGLQ